MIKEKHARKHLKQAKKALNSLDFEKARIEFQRAFKMNPKYEIIYQHFATLLDAEDGVKVYTKAIEINPEFAEVLVEVFCMKRFWKMMKKHWRILIVQFHLTQKIILILKLEVIYLND